MSKKEKKSFASKLPCFKKKNEEEKEDEKEEIKKVSFLQLFRYAEKLDYLLMFIGAIASLITGVSLPMLVLVFGDMTTSFTNSSYNQISNSTAAISNDAFWNEIKETIYYYLIIGAVVLVTGYVQIACWLTVSYRQTFKIRNHLFKSILRQEIGWFDTNDVGQLATRLSADVNKIQEGIGDKFSTFFQWISTFLSGIIVGFVRGPKLAGVVIAISPLIAIAGGIMTYLITAATSKELTAYAKAGSVAEEMISAIRTVVAFSGQEKAIEKYTKHLREAKIFGIKKGIMGGLGMGTSLGIIFCSYALAFWYGGKLIRDKEMEIGEVLTVFFAVVIGAFALGNAGPSLQSIAAARGAAFHLWEIMNRVPMIDSSSREGVSPAFSGNIEFQDVHFNYPSRKEIKILKGLSMRLEQSLTVAVVGESGCGKSTVIQLLERFYDPDSGSVLVDGTDLRKMNIKWLRKHIGVVNQEPVLFATTIAMNISYGLEGATQAQVEEAAKQANAHDFILTLPQKYETIVGERGAQMSGGQKQRIAIARALINNPKILLLDEATSALDNESEAIVQAALEKASAGRTTIVVAHRLSTIKTADVIFGIKEGVVHESGTHEELMNLKGIYYTLVTSQQGVGKEESEDESSEEEKETEEKKKTDFEEVSFKRENSSRRSKSRRRRTISTAKEVEKKEAEEVVKDVSIMRLMALNRPEWYYIVFGCIGALIQGAIQPAFAILFAKFIGTFGANVNEEDRKSLVELLSILFVVIGVITLLSMVLMSTMFSISGEKLTERVRILLFKHLIRQNVEFFDDPNNSVGALVTRLSTDASAVQGGTGTRLGMFCQALSSIGVGVIIGFVYSWQMTLLILGCLPLLVAGATVEMKMAKGFSGDNNAALEDAGKIATEAISNIRTVAILCKEEMFAQQYHDRLYGPHKSNLCKAHLSGLTYSLSQSLIYFSYSAIFALGGHLTNTGVLNYEDMFLVFGVIIFGAMALGQASQFAPDYSKVKASLGRIFALLDSKPSLDIYAKEGLIPGSINGSVNFVDVTFAYPTRKSAMVLNKLNFSVKPGTSIALVGFSGSGKSTTIQLLERFYDCLSGSILLDQHNIKSLNVLWLRSQLGLVQQEPILFDCSIRENIAYGDNSREVSMDEIIEAAKKSNIAEFIKNLPQGYETNVGEKGVQLSGGQKQRVAIARALVRNPKILLLDEATSALDTESEKVVQEALQKAQEGRTSLVIAHRLSTIQNSDCIFVFNNGVIAEYGTHAELINQKEIYFKLAQTQS